MARYLALATLLLTQAQPCLCAKSLKSKVAVITGASSGIGMVTAKELAKQGMSVVLLARRVEKLAEVVEEIKKEGGEATAKACDVESAVSIEWAFEFAKSKYGGVDFVFANAGIEGELLKTALTSQSDAGLHSMFNINAIGAIETLKYAVKAFDQRGGGTIAFSSSVGGFCGDMCQKAFTQDENRGSVIGYAATKAAVDMIAEGAHGSYFDKGINVYTFNIAAMASEMGDRLGLPVDDCPINPIMKKRLGDPVHIAEVIIAILDGTSKWPAGSAIAIDNDITVHAKHFFDKRKDPGALEHLGWRSPEELKKFAMNVRGEPYVFKDEL